MTSNLLPDLTSASASEIVAFGVEKFGDDLVLLFSGQDAVLVDVALKVDPRIELVFIDTGFHFNETIETVLAVAERYQPKLRVVSPWRHLDGVGTAGFCCSDHKVEQLDRALDGRSAWLSGLRRDDSADRASVEAISTDRRGLIKLNPILEWSDAEVDSYITANDIIVNPLRDRGYPSIGCRPCTTPVGENELDSRAGRWAGSCKTECGIHL